MKTEKDYKEEIKELNKEIKKYRKLNNENNLMILVLEDRNQLMNYELIKLREKKWWKFW